MPKKITNAEYVERLKQKHNGKILPLEEYKGNEVNIKVKCLIDEHIWDAKPNNLINGGKGCPMCKHRKIGVLSTKTNEEFLKDLQTVHGDIYSPIDTYKSSKIKIKILCNECKNNFEINPDDLINGEKGCPNCNLSHGAKKILKILKDNNILFRTEVTFKDLLSDKNQYLRFDFGIIDKSNNIKYLIEFDGQQHFKPIDIFGGDDGFKTIQKNDKLKDEYCNKNNIHLIRISYKDINNVSIQNLTHE